MRTEDQVCHERSRIVLLCPPTTERQLSYSESWPSTDLSCSTDNNNTSACSEAQMQAMRSMVVAKTIEAKKPSVLAKYYLKHPTVIKKNQRYCSYRRGPAVYCRGENTSFEAENMTGGTAQNTTMQQEGFTSFKIFQICIFIATIVVGLIGNGLVIFLTGCRMKTTVNSIWFLNLAIADFLFMLSSIINNLSVLGRWHLYFMSCLNPILYVFMCDEYKKKLKQSLLLVLETAFAEDHLDFKAENTSSEAGNMTGSTAQNITMQQEGFTSFEIFSLCIFIPTFVVGLIGNGLVIFLTGCRMKKTINSIWFLNLAIADFIFMLSSISYSVILSVLGRQQIISLDRCLCTWMVVWAKNKRTLLKAKIICLIVWVSSISCSIPFYKDNMPLIKFEFTLGFLIPFLIIASSYTAIGVRIKRLKRGKQLRSYRVIISVTLAFFICWFPYYVCVFYSITPEGNKRSASDQDIFKIVSIYLVCLNSCLNPILYVFMCDEYKKKLKQSLLLVLEITFAEEYLDFKADAKERLGHENPTELLDM
ncbi:hypothetical protein cypCar_00037832 [Cyprinus carpio]|nr:hypothetical protein cypCar_00037832 [Cyprinus carpio]